MKPTLQLGCSQPPIGHQNFNYLGQVIKPNQKFITCSTKKERKKKIERKEQPELVSIVRKEQLSLLLQHPTLFSSPLFFSLGVLPSIFSPKYFFQPKNTFFSSKRFYFSPKLFLLQPKTFFSSATLLFFFFLLYSFLVQPSLFSLSAPPFFLFFSSIYPRPNILFSCFTSLLFE